MRNSRGFFLADMILSFSMLLLITASLLPIYIHLSKQMRGTDLELKATHVLYESLHAFLIEGVLETGEIERDGALFIVEKQGSKVCVNYEDSFKKERKKCETLK